MASDRPSGGGTAVADLVGHKARKAAVEHVDEAQLSDAFRAHRHELNGFARRRLFGDSVLAEEAVQEAFLRAWKSRHLFDPARGSLRMWLFAICRTTAVDASRARARADRDRAHAVTPGCGDDGGLDQLAARWQVEEALRTLPPWQRDAVVHVHLRELSYADAASSLGVPAGTVKSRVHLGLRGARAVLSRASGPTAECA